MNGDLLRLIAIAVAGALAGLASGWLAVTLERIEKLEQEENEDHEAYDKEMDDLIAAAEKDGTTVPVKEPWEYEKYGWTWLEWGLSPVLGALSFAWFWHAAYDHVPFTDAATVHRLLIIHLFWLSVFVHIVAFDIKHRLILNRITFPAAGLALAVSFFTPGLGFVPALIGGVSVFLIFLAQNLAFGSKVIGRGDAKLGAVLGALTGLSFNPPQLNAVLAVMVAFILGGVGAIAVLLVRSIGATLKARRPMDVPRLFFGQLRRSMKEPIPYGPFLCAGAVLLLLNNQG